MTSFLKQTLPQTSNHLTQMQMKRNTLTALLALALSTWSTPNVQAQTEEQHLNHAVSYDLPRLVAQKGVENVYDAIGTLPGIVVKMVFIRSADALLPCLSTAKRRTFPTTNCKNCCAPCLQAASNGWKLYTILLHACKPTHH